ncbi:MAG: MarR family transcriptional regulator [Clostridia bacterium]|nr:MarR family transcriptional regulator [Clostridia bacterium]
MDPRCKRLTELSAQSQQLYRQLAERFLLRACEARGLSEAICFGDYVFLAAVGESPEGCATMSKIARLLNINPSTATRQVNRLLFAGMVTKSVAPDDDRRYEIRVTAAGRELLTAMEEALYAAVQSAFQSVTDEELNTVYNYLEKYNGSLTRQLDEE